MTEGGTGTAPKAGGPPIDSPITAVVVVIVVVIVKVVGIVAVGIVVVEEMTTEGPITNVTKAPPVGKTISVVAEILRLAVSID